MACIFCGCVQHADLSSSSRLVSTTALGAVLVLGSSDLGRVVVSSTVATARYELVKRPHHPPDLACDGESSGLVEQLSCKMSVKNHATTPHHFGTLGSRLVLLLEIKL